MRVVVMLLAVVVGFGLVVVIVGYLLPVQARSDGVGDDLLRTPRARCGRR